MRRFVKNVHNYSRCNTQIEVCFQMCDIKNFVGCDAKWNTPGSVRKLSTFFGGFVLPRVEQKTCRLVADHVK